MTRSRFAAALSALALSAAAAGSIAATQEQGGQGYGPGAGYGPGYGRGPSFHHYESTSIVCQPSCVCKRRPTGECQRKRRDHGVAGAGNVHRLLRTNGRNMQGRPVVFQ